MLSGESVSSITKPSLLSVSYFKSGGGNHLYLIKADKQQYLARVNFYPLKNSWQIKNHEYTCLKMLETLNIAPKAYFIDSTGRFLEQHFIIIDFIEGTTLQILDDSIIISLANTLKKLHASMTFSKSGNSLPPTDDSPYTCEIFDEFADGADKQIEQYNNLPGISIVIEPFNRIKTKLKEWFDNKNCFENCSTFSLCHADLKAENILVTTNGIQLIDWECAGSDIPETDIGRLFSGCQFTNMQEKLFLQHYYPTSPKSKTLERIATVKTVLDFFRILEDYILLKRKKWDALAMKKELEIFLNRL